MMELSQVKAIVDCCNVKVFGGKGGDGCVSLARICNNPFAGPDGGDGGNGGHVIFKVIIFKCFGMIAQIFPYNSPLV